MVLEKIQKANDIKKLKPEELEVLAQEIRDFLIEKISVTGGHLASNLGVVELTMAMHLIFDLPEDKIIWDVGHQAYTHKLLTGRKAGFDDLRKYGGMSGFPKRKESDCDAFDTGHSSTSISAGLGYVEAREILGQDHKVISVIGDGAMTGGMAYEALNNAAGLKSNFIIVLNDNNMSISENVGAMDQAFTKLRVSKPYTTLKHDLKGALSTSKFGKSVLHTMQNVKNAVKENVVDTSIFGDFNLDYIGPIDGHNLPSLIRVLKLASENDGPVVVHVLTKKGKGYSYAEEDKTGSWHGVSPFDVRTGKSLSQMPMGHASWSEVMSSTLTSLAAKNKDIVAITPAMKSGSKLQNFFDKYPERSFDCGIAEEHAMTFAAGLAVSGKRPFISVYSSFLQRAYDQINHDVARMNLPVVIGIDRCGLVGEDGETHHGVFDIAMLRHIPNMILSQPKDAKEAQNLLYSAFQQKEHPYAIRYPRGNVPFEKAKEYTYIEPGTWTSWSFDEHSRLIIITYGDCVDKIISKAQVNQMPITVVNARFFKPLDGDMLERLCQMELPILLYETDMLAGGLSSSILEYANDHGYTRHFVRLGIEDHFVEHGSISQLRKLERLDINSLFDIISSYL